MIGDHHRQLVEQQQQLSQQLYQLQQQQQQQQHQIVGITENNLAENVIQIDNKLHELSILHSQSLSTVQQQISLLNNSLHSLQHEEIPALLHNEIPALLNQQLHALLPPIQTNYQVIENTKSK